MLVAVLAILGALIPTIFYVAVVWWLDRYEKNLFGSWRCLSLGCSPGGDLFGAWNSPWTFRSVPWVARAWWQPGEVSLNAPLVEETAKGIALVALVLPSP